MSSPKRRVRSTPKLPRKRPGPAGGKRDQNRRAQQLRLIETALGLFVADGIAAVSIDQIVGGAAMAKGSFYRYARDKADLVDQIMAPVMSEVIAALDRCERALRGASPDTLASTYTRLATELAVVVGNHASRVLLYVQEVRAPAGPALQAIHTLADQLTDRTVRLTTIARDHGLIRDVNPEVSALTVLGAVDAIVFAYLRRRRVLAADVPTVIADLVAIVLHGIRG